VNPLTYTDTKQDFYKEMFNAHPLVVNVNIICLPWVGESCYKKYKKEDKVKYNFIEP
jgi:hypothetical protein